MFVGAVMPRQKTAFATEELMLRAAAIESIATQAKKH
jgi:hypothetical protein